MSTSTFAIVVSTIVLLAGCAGSDIGTVDFPEGSVQHAVHAGDIEWKRPPTLPPGAEIYVLEGDPQSEDLFTVRFKIEEGFVMPAHTHPKDERVTVLSGKMAVAFGTGATLDDATRFGPGDYYVNSRDAVHTVWAVEESIIQITGIGPWEANFVESGESVSAN